MNPVAFPLAWPAGWRRMDPSDRIAARFGRAGRNTGGGFRGLSIAEACDRVLTELLHLGIPNDEIVISTNIRPTISGIPRSSERAPEDPGVAVYWVDPRNEARRCLAVDRYLSVAGNLGAIAATLEAMRAIERHGGAEILERAFTGFVALPAPDGTAWWEVLGIARTATLAEINVAYRCLSSAAHPDKPGGSHERMLALNSARDAARLERES